MAEDDATRIRNWLADVIAKTGLKPTTFAKEVGLAPSTVNRALDAKTGITLERRSISLIVNRFKVAPPNLGPADASQPPVEQGDVEMCDRLPAVVGSIALQQSQFARKATSRVLELAGIARGDTLVFDVAGNPRAGDVVLAEIGDAGRPTILLRQYEPPFLVARSCDPFVSLRPILVDGERVRVVGVLIWLVRERALSA